MTSPAACSLRCHSRSHAMRSSKSAGIAASSGALLARKVRTSSAMARSASLRVSRMRAAPLHPELEFSLAYTMVSRQSRRLHEENHVDRIHPPHLQASDSTDALRSSREGPAASAGRSAGRSPPPAPPLSSRAATPTRATSPRAQLREAGAEALGVPCHVGKWAEIDRARRDRRILEGRCRRACQQRRDVADLRASERRHRGALGQGHRREPQRSVSAERADRRGDEGARARARSSTSRARARSGRRRTSCRIPRPRRGSTR